MSTKTSLESNSTPKDFSTFYQHYENHIPIKKGGFGTVFEATEKYSERKVAIKRVRLRIGAEQVVLEELKVLSKLDHPHILRYYNSWTEPVEYHRELDQELFNQTDISRSLKSTTSEASSLFGRSCVDDVNMARSFTNYTTDGCIVFESTSEKKPIENVSSSSINYTTSSEAENEQQNISKPYKYLYIVTNLCKIESLEDRLLPEYRSENPINRFDALYIFYQIVSGVRYLHNAMNMIHCDLKPGNILFSLYDDTVKIADFGLTLTQQASLPNEEDDVKSNENKPVGGTKFYMTENVEPISFKRDIYALGIILYELLYPFSSRSERANILTNLRKSVIEFPSDFEEKHGNTILKDLIVQLLSYIPDQRPNIIELQQNIRRRLETDHFEENDTMVLKMEHILNNPPIKQISLTTDDIQYGVYDTSDQYILLADDKKLKLYNIEGELIDEYQGLHESYHHIGNVQRIVWCESLRQFLIVCQYYLYAFTPHSKTDLTKMQKVYFINKHRENSVLRFITCTTKHVFINYSYDIIRQYNIPQWSLFREWTKTKLFYEEVDQIRRMTCSRMNDYMALNVCLDKCQWIIDIRRIDDNLSFLKRIQIPNLGIKHHLQLSCREWLISNEKNQFCILDIWEDEPRFKIIQTNLKSESDIYPRFFDNYLIVPIIQKQNNVKLNEDDSIQRQGFLYFYRWK